MILFGEISSGDYSVSSEVFGDAVQIHSVEHAADGIRVDGTYRDAWSGETFGRFVVTGAPGAALLEAFRRLVAA